MSSSESPKEIFIWARKVRSVKHSQPSEVVTDKGLMLPSNELSLEAPTFKPSPSNEPSLDSLTSKFQP